MNIPHSLSESAPRAIHHRAMPLAKGFADMRTRPLSSTVFAVACALALCAGNAAASGGYFGGARDANVLQAEDDGLDLKAGQFRWLPGAEGSDGPVTMLVNLRDQRAYLYRDGRRIAVTTVSTGRRGHDTPTGAFPILGKQPMYHSRRYDNAPMPWMQRLTDWGHALHAGQVRPYPASHGCVRLPAEFAKQLYTMTNRGDLVIIARDDTPRALAIALKVAEMDPSTALAVGVTEPLPQIVWIGEQSRANTRPAGAGGGNSF
jgi:hypothetical protein